MPCRKLRFLLGYGFLLPTFVFQLWCYHQILSHLLCIHSLCTAFSVLILPTIEQLCGYPVFVVVEVLGRSKRSLQHLQILKLQDMVNGVHLHPPGEL